MKLIERLKKVRDLHRSFEDLIPHIAEGSKEATIKAYQTLNEEIREISEILDEAFTIGREFEGSAKETIRVLMQMKGILEDVLSNLDDRGKLEFHVKKLLSFNRSFDYIVTENLNTLITYAEFVEIVKEGKIPSSVLDKISEVERFAHKLDALIKFLRLLYDKPSDIFKVEFSLRKANESGMRWVDEWYLQKDTGLSGDEIRDILDSLTLIGVVERKERGGGSVYRVRDIGED